MALGLKARSFKRSKPHEVASIDGMPFVQRQGTTYWVDANINGSGDGKSLQSAFTTMAEAFAAVASGDTIYLRGKVREQLITPVQVFDVSVIGLGNRPRHADSTPDGGQTAANTWAAPASPTADTALVQVLQQGWKFENILFAGSAGCPSVHVVRNAGAGDAERDASHAIIRGCKFAGVASTDQGVEFGAAGSYSENVNNVLIEDCDFFNCATGISSPAAYHINSQIIGNRFLSNTNDIVTAAVRARIIGNVMSLAPTGCIVLTGGSANQVHGNYLPGTYADGTLYDAGTSDNWNGNYASTGVTAAVPA